MATVSTEYKRGFLRWVNSSRGATALLAYLTTLLATRINATQSGNVVTLTSANGQSTQLAAPVGSSLFSPQAAAELVSEMLDRYDAALAAIGGSPSDTAIYTEMMAQLQPATELYNDFSQVNYQ